MGRHLFTPTLSSVLTIPAASRAEFKGGFADVGTHHLDWIGRTTEKSSIKSHRDDFGYLELEGSANFSWGEMYGFFDWEDFYNDRYDKPNNEQCYTFKSINRICLGDTGLNPYLHTYDTYDSANRVNFHDNMSLYGIGYDLTGSGWWFGPFSAKRCTDQTHYTGDSGYVTGQVAGYSFMLDSKKFTLISWSEYEFDRDTTYTVGNDGKEGPNGAIILWWNATLHTTTGIQCRYADDKLDEDFYQDTIIYSIKPDFQLITAGAPGSMDSLYIQYSESPSRLAISALPWSRTTSYSACAAVESEQLFLRTNINWRPTTGIARSITNGLLSGNGSTSVGRILMPMSAATVGNSVVGRLVSCTIFARIPLRASATLISGRLPDA